MAVQDAPDIPYAAIAASFRNHTIVPFLGAAASFAGAPPGPTLPSGSAFARLLAEKYGYPGQPSDPLTKIAQFVQDGSGDREFLLDDILALFFHGIPQDYSSSVTDFLTTLPVEIIPRLIVTTNYGILIERTLELRQIPYIAISHIMGGSKYAGRLLCYRSLDPITDQPTIMTAKQVNSLLQELSIQDQLPVLLYRIHGSSCSVSQGARVDSIVLTENDYVDFLAENILHNIPTRVLNFLNSSRLLFLGYSLEDWNFRVLLRRLQLLQSQQQKDPRRHWACLKDADQVEVKFWDRRGVNLYHQSLELFLTHLSDAIRRGTP